MRVLHARHDHERDRPAAAQRRSDGKGDPRLAGRQPVPVYGLSRHRQVDTDGREINVSPPYHARPGKRERIMYQFDYQAPDSIEAALAALRGNDEAMILAGGMTLLPTMKLRLARPDVLIDINRIEALAGIGKEDGAIVIGAMTRHADVAASELVLG